MSGVFKLLTNVGDVAGQDIIGEWIHWDGGPGNFIVWGDLGGGKAQMEISPDAGTTAICSPGTLLNTIGIVDFNLRPGFQIRATLKNTTSASSGVNVKVYS